MLYTLGKLNTFSLFVNDTILHVKATKKTMKSWINNM